MAITRFDVLGIGNAIVDIIGRAREDFLLRHGMQKGAMTLIEAARAQSIYAAMGPAIEISGGSAANTIVVAASAITYLEGYLWDPKNAKDAFLKAAGVAHEARRLVALTLSDAFCVDRWREEFLQLIRGGIVDVTFANESEVKSLYQTADFDTAVSALRRDAALAVVTRSEQGCCIVSREGTQRVAAVPIERLVDATGAGDLFAAGFLFGLARGVDLSTAARLGALAAAEVIQHLGARPETSLEALAQQNGLPA